MFKYTTAIKKIRNMQTRKKVIQGGTSAGKTYAILAVLIDKAIKNSGLEISVVSESIPHLRKGALKDFLKIMKQTNRYIPENYNKSHLKYEFTNGSYIEFFSVQDESKLRGARRNVLYVNEANNIHYDSYYQMAIRTSGDIFIDYNPTNTFWVHTEVLKEDDAQFLIITFKDNEALPDTIIKELYANKEKAKHSEYWKNWWRVYGLGLTGRLEGTIFENWDEVDVVPSDAKLIGYGLDFGYTNDPSALIGVYKMNNELYIDELLYAKEYSNNDIANVIKSDAVKGGEIYADSAEPKSIDEIKRYGIKIYPTKKGRDSIMYGIDILQNYKMHITKRSSNLKDELSRYSWKKNKEGNYENVPIDYYNHALDALRYLAMMKLSNRKIGTKTFKII